jgi:hypothetical protein
MRVIENDRVCIGLADNPGLTQETQLFVLIDEPQLKAARSQLEDEIGPQLNTLLERAEKAIDLLDAKEQSLRSRVRFKTMKPPARLFIFFAHVVDFSCQVIPGSRSRQSRFGHNRCDKTRRRA